MKKKEDWKEAKRRFHLTDTQVRMARELGMNPQKLGKLAPNGSEPWKAPLGAFIERCPRRRFGKAKKDINPSNRVQSGS
jgi:hypothetical protein